ncbi:ABC transporter substrate-binding protein [Ramlibacter sp. 2FC]|uniref:ABC transporter substrate-binding protein n=1 Tax=Ramlibacter sp. 2FC TaxID=2502188 RepID=UPI0010F82BB7|nr:ABC transporter substrate-binding protein [Ramlibacter sp. 2FC]
MNHFPSFSRIRHTAGMLAIGAALFAGAMTGVSAQTLKIGVIAPLTGPGAPWGLSMQHGASILASQINAKGGLEVSGKKHRIEIVAYDDQYKTVEAVSAYNRLVKQDGVKYVVILTSIATMALKQRVEDDKVIGVSSGITPKAFDASSKYMFRLLSTPADYVPGYVAWLKDNRKERRVAILNPNDETGWDLTKLSERVYNEKGFTVLTAETFERSTKDFQPLLTKVLAMKPDLIELSAIAPATAGLVIRQARELGYKGLFTKNSGPGPKDIVAAAGKEDSEGVYNLLYVDRENAAFQQLAAEYKKTVGHEANDTIATYYDGLNVLFKAIQEGGDVNDTGKVAAAFGKALPMKSILGDELILGGMKNFGADRQIMTTDYIAVIKNGEPKVVGKIR